MAQDDAGKLRLQVRELKKEKSDLENELQKARNAESAAVKAKVAAEEKAEVISDLEAKLDAAEKEKDRLAAEVQSLAAQSAKVEQVLEDVDALKRLVGK